MTTGLATVPATAETLQLLQPQQQERPLKALKQNQQVPVSVTPVQKQKKCTWKSLCKKALAKTVKQDRESKEDEEATASQRWITEPSSRPSQELEEETEETITAWSLSLSELREIQEDFSHCPGECIITWLLQCWDNRANSVELESKEARESGLLAKKLGIDKAMGKKTQALCLWRWLLWSVRVRCPYKEGIPCNLSKWAAMEKCVVYLRELAIWGIVNIDLDNVQLSPGADDALCQWFMVEIWRECTNHACQPLGNNKLERWCTTKVKWFSTSRNTKTVFLPPLLQLWRSYQINWHKNWLRVFSISERVCPIPHLYGPLFLQLTAGVLLLKRCSID